MERHLVFTLLGLSLVGCTSHLVKDDTQYPRVGTLPCAGSEWVDDSTLAVVPIPLIAIFTPRADLHEIKADDYLKRCGDSRQLVNRQVYVSRAACVPAALSWVLTLGVWQWCPAHVHWRADVAQD